MEDEIQGILLIDKPAGKTSFSLVATLRRHLGVKKIGHSGTLDPFATGVMVMLVGRNYTKLSDQFLTQDKEYVARIHLGISTDTHDCEGNIVEKSEKIPTFQEIEQAAQSFQGEIQQTPPMFSAKKINGKKLYELARKGQVIERQPVKVNVTLTINNYEYPYLDITVKCSKGTYIRSIADDLGKSLGCFGHLTALKRTQSGKFFIHECLEGQLLQTFSPEMKTLIKNKLLKFPFHLEEN